jgi:hypothetical protein
MKLRRSRSLRRLVVMLTTLVAGLTLIVTPSGAQQLGPRAAFSGPTTFTVNAPGAPVLCHVNVGNDVTLYDGYLNVTWAVACRWTDDNQLSTEVDAIFMAIGIRQGTTIMIPAKQCPVALRPDTTCSHRVPFPGLSGHYDSIMQAVVTWKDGYPPIRGTFISPGITVT